MIDLKKFRKSKNLTQTNIADAIGVLPNRISKYEKGTERPQSIEKRILDIWPEAAKFIVDAPHDLSDLNIKYEHQQNEIIHLKKIIQLLEEKVEDYKKMLSLVEKNNNK